MFGLRVPATWLLPAFAVLGAGAAQAQTGETLVSNTGQTIEANTVRLGHRENRHTQGFRTGSNASGYHLNSVGVHVHDESLESGETFTVHIYTADASGAADTLEYTLTSPDPYIDDAINVFTAPGGAMLSADTDYLVVFQATGNTGDDFMVSVTDSNAEDAASAAGWSIEDARRFDGALVGSGSAFAISVNGRAVSSNDATLSGLDLKNAVDDLPIAIDPAFDSAITAYTASVGNAVETITVEPTTRDDGATVKYLDDDGSIIADADSKKPGRQVSLSEGENVIKVEVTAEDDTATQTYTVVATRRAPNDPPRVPRNAASGQPAITGTAQVGEVLSAGKGTIADTDGTTKADKGDVGFAYTYQWVRVDGSSETDITNATASTYTLAAEDAGLKVKVRLSFTDDAGNDEGPLVSEAYPATGTIALADGNHPATGQPAITGTAWVGKTLTADLSGIADEDGTAQADNDAVGFAYTYQWVQVDGETETDITGATSKTYALAPADQGKTVKVKVSFTDDADFDEGPLTSEAYPATGTIVARNSKKALVSNTSQPFSVTVYDLSGRGKKHAQGFRTGPSAGGYYLDAVGVYAEFISSSPRVSFTVHVYTVAANNTFDTLAYTLTPPDSYTDSAVNEFRAPAGAVLAANTKYQIVFDARGRQDSDDVLLFTTSSDAEDPGSAAGWGIANVSRFEELAQGPKFLISVRGSVVGVAATGQPAITGTAQVGQTLTAGKGTITDANGTTKADNGNARFAYTYQWVQVDGETETDIANATDSTYTLAAEDAGKTVKVKVSFTDDANFDEGPLTSEPYPATGTIALADGNHPATGVPAISGTARVGQTLTADLSGIADEDGTVQADNDAVGYAYTYQWVQVDGETETDITGATDSTAGTSV